MTTLATVASEGTVTVSSQRVVVFRMTDGRAAASWASFHGRACEQAAVEMRQAQKRPHGYSRSLYETSAREVRDRSDANRTSRYRDMVAAANRQHPGASAPPVPGEGRGGADDRSHQPGERA